MQLRFVGFIVGVLVLLGFHPAIGEAQLADDHQEPESLKLDMTDDLRMTPLSDSENTAQVLSPDVPFSLASRPCDYSLTELLLNKSIDPLLEGCEPETGLSVALALHDMKLLRLLLENGADPNTALSPPVPRWLMQLFDNNYIARTLAKDLRVTPLMLAVLSEQTDAVRLLLQHGASTQICTRVFRMYPLDFAAELKSVPMMQLILGQEPTRDGQGRHVIVSISTQKAWFMQDSSVLLETAVSTGRTGYPTRPGEYVVTQKYPSWKSTLYKVPMPNFMRLNCGQTGLHGGFVPGVPASHGCIRLPGENAAALYQVIHPGDRVSVVE